MKDLFRHPEKEYAMLLNELLESFGFTDVYVEADNEDQATDFTHKYLLGVYGCKNVRILQCEFDLNPKIDEL